MSKTNTETGTLVSILETESGESKAGKSWTRRSFVIETDAKYNPTICFGLFGEEKCQMIEGFEVGATIEVAFNISSREYNGKYYNDINAWQINEVGAVESAREIPAETSDIDEDVPF